MLSRTWQYVRSPFVYAIFPSSKQRIPQVPKVTSQKNKLNLKEKANFLLNQEKKAPQIVLFVR